MLRSHDHHHMALITELPENYKNFKHNKNLAKSTIHISSRIRPAVLKILEHEKLISYYIEMYEK
jgi:hypothetical protein